MTTVLFQYIQDGPSLFDSYSISSAWWDYAMDLFYGNGSARLIPVQNLVRPFISKLTSSIIQTSNFTLCNGTFAYSQMLNATGPSQILAAIPTRYSIANIQTRSTFPVRSQSAPDGRTLLTFPSATSTVIVEYTSRLS